MLKRYLSALILLLSGYLSATTVTGTIQDTNGNRYSNGTVSAFSVITGASMTPAATDANGSFSIILSPSTYTFTVCAKPVNIGPNGGTSVTQVCAQPATPIVISGGSQDVSAQINAVAPILGPSVAALLGANNAFTGANTHAGLETFNGLVSLTNILTGSGSAAIAGTFGGSPTMTGNWTMQGNNSFTGSNTFSLLTTFGQTVNTLGAIGSPVVGRTYTNPAWDFFSVDNSVQTTNTQAKSDSTAAPLIRARSWQFGGATVAPLYLESFGFGTGSVYGVHGQIDILPTWRGTVEANNIVTGIDNAYQINNIVLTSGVYTVTIADGSTPAYLGGARVPNCQVGDSLHLGRVTDSFYNNGNAVGFSVTSVSYPNGGPYTIQFAGSGSHASSSGGVVTCFQGQIFAFETNLTNNGASQAQFLTPTMEQNFTGIYGHVVTGTQGAGDVTAGNYVVGIQGKSTEGGRVYIGDLVNDAAEAGFRCGYYKSSPGTTLYMPLCTENDQRNIAVNGTNYPSIPDGFHASYWNGASATDAWLTWGAIPDAGTNPLVWHTMGYHTGALNAADTVIFGVSNNGAIKSTENAAPYANGLVGLDLLWPDSAAHRWKMSNNNGTPITVAATSGDTFTATTLTSPVVNGTPTGTGTATLTLKKGSGAGNYSNASTTPIAVDGTNLTYTVTIPTGWKLGISASGSVTTSTAVATATVQLYDGVCNSGTALQSVQSIPTAASNPESWSLNDMVTGDGASHTINLCYSTSVGADTVTMLNSTAPLAPRMLFNLVPSN
jgi:hypothetical protein